MAYLILVRHGISEWNKSGTWTGQVDSPLAPEGKEQAQQMAEQIRDIPIHATYTSKLSRARDTLTEIKRILQLHHLPTIEHEALNERHYGDYQGQNKWQIKETVGDEEFKKIRRSWDHPIPNGESMKQVYERVIPYYEKEILADLKAGKNVLISASGNSLRSLMKKLDNLADEAIANLEMGLGEVHVYEVDGNGTVLSKEIRNKNETAGSV